jgi:hypothetical protein
MKAHSIFEYGTLLAPATGSATATVGVPTTPLDLGTATSWVEARATDSGKAMAAEMVRVEAMEMDGGHAGRFSWKLSDGFAMSLHDKKTLKIGRSVENRLMRSIIKNNIYNVFDFYILHGYGESPGAGDGDGCGHGSSSNEYPYTGSENYGDGDRGGEGCGRGDGGAGCGDGGGEGDAGGRLCDGDGDGFGDSDEPIMEERSFLTWRTS